jgi:hypothetical protein
MPSGIHQTLESHYNDSQPIMTAGIRGSSAPTDVVYQQIGKIDHFAS